MIIRFVVPGKPISKARHRTRVVKNKTTGKSFATMYTPKTTTSFQNSVRLFFYQKYTGSPLEGPISVKIFAFFQPPKKKASLITASITDIPVITKPDVDNVAKAVLDGLNTVAFKDDSQVSELFIGKYYSNNPRIEIVISQLIPQILKKGVSHA
ncbi:MAG: RusA family crossover junction endodeoxyribonuclease [Bacteroidetes bacterium]|nr:RusA family crossover junction endodeoxyribonuclease [Bacteroidota bacterium]